MRDLDTFEREAFKHDLVDWLFWIVNLVNFFLWIHEATLDPSFFLNLPNITVGESSFMNSSYMFSKVLFISVVFPPNITVGESSFMNSSHILS